MKWVNCLSIQPFIYCVLLKINLDQLTFLD